MNTRVMTLYLERQCKPGFVAQASLPSAFVRRACVLWSACCGTKTQWVHDEKCLHSNNGESHAASCA